MGTGWISLEDFERAYLERLRDLSHLRQVLSRSSYLPH